jgi:hypothetical protein
VVSGLRGGRLCGGASVVERRQLTMMLIADFFLLKDSWDDGALGRHRENNSYFVLYVLLLLLCPDKVTFYIQTHNLGE